MHPAQPLQTPAQAQAAAAHDRRKRAAWIDYLRTVREVAASEYGDVERESWERLQRRLRRNDELLAAGR